MGVHRVLVVAKMYQQVLTEVVELCDGFTATGRKKRLFKVKPTNGFDVGEKIVIAGQSGLKEDSLIRELGDPIPGKTNAVPSSVSTKVSTSLTTSTKASVKVAK